MSIIASDSDSLTRKPSSNGTNTSWTSDTTSICGCAREPYNNKNHPRKTTINFNGAKYTLRVKNVGPSTTTASNSQIVKSCHCWIQKWKLELNKPTSLKSSAALPCKNSVFVCYSSYLTQGDTVQSCLITVNIHLRCWILVQINLQCVQMSIVRTVHGWTYESLMLCQMV